MITQQKEKKMEGTKYVTTGYSSLDGKSQHFDNKAKTEALLMDDEYDKCTTDTEQQCFKIAPKNVYVEQRENTSMSGADNIPTMSPRFSQKSHSSIFRQLAPPSVSISETTQISDHTISDTSTSSSDWEVNDYKFSKMHGKFLENNQLSLEYHNVQHPALKGLGLFEPRRGNDLTVNMTHVETNTPAAKFIVRSAEVPDPGNALPPVLENLLHDDMTDLLQNARTIYVNILNSIDDSRDTSANKQTEETLQNFERKVDKIEKRKTELNETYKIYIVQYTYTNNIGIIGHLSKELASVLRSMREGVNNLRTQAAPKIGYEEITYAELKDTRAPYLNITEFNGESSLPIYLKWIHDHKNLPANLLNEKLAVTLPSLVYSRLCQHHPESSRTADQIIKFLLKTYGRTANIEEQLKEYHANIGTLNNLFIDGNENSINPYNCSEILTNADKHLVGIKAIDILKKICNTYLDNDETQLWFQDSLHTHSFCTWLALNTLTMNQVLTFTQKGASTGEEKIKWISAQIEDLRSKAERMMCIAASMHNMQEY